MKYISKNHSKFLLMTHLIFVCKYRKKLLIRLGDDIKKLFYAIAEEKDLNIIEMEVGKDHIHLLVQYSPTQSILQIVRWFKQISTYRVWRVGKTQYYLNNHFWQERTFWSDGYFACSIGKVSKETIEKYIQQQG
ncbi:IS200/IS605 family transposase [Clostridium haemolyticum]|uniref:Transposase n=1 Tax=Clostridium haemolyticum NCTC 9693 TaxID=1443114 RepID=A0ABR4TB76_CLOHA|nr:IS200/IS605 family transposase [Clostridium haemolyticum]KEI14177.1 putative transposase [Clostridium haemolyticum NCTC 9693]